MTLVSILQAVAIVAVGTALLRIAGRKSIAQMAVPQTVIMIGIGSLLVQPITGQGLGNTFVYAGVLVLTLVLMELLQLRWDFFENLTSGKAMSVIENGQLNVRHMRKLRLTLDKLNMRLRLAQVSSLDDVQQCTLEPNGQLGIVLKPSAQPATKQDLQDLRQSIEVLLDKRITAPPSEPKQDLFDQISKPKQTPDSPTPLQ